MDTDAYDFAPTALGSGTPPITDDVKTAIRQMEIERVTADLRAQGLFDVPSGPTLLEMKDEQYRRTMEPAALADVSRFIVEWNERAVQAGFPVRLKVINRTTRDENQAALIGAAGGW